jgi:anoctamin-10
MERKIAVQYGTHKVSRVEHLRPQYLAKASGTSGIAAPANASMNSTLSPSPRDTEFLKREAKMAASVPILAACGTLLGALLTGIFIFEAFFAHLYAGPGKQLLSLVPTLLFVGVVPNIVAILHGLGKKLTVWENHPTKSSFEKSLTLKTL